MHRFTQEKPSQSLMQVIEVRLRGGARASPSILMGKFRKYHEYFPILQKYHSINFKYQNYHKIF
jgi:hypothetical protein